MDATAPPELCAMHSTRTPDWNTCGVPHHQWPQNRFYQRNVARVMKTVVNSALPIEPGRSWPNQPLKRRASHSSDSLNSRPAMSPSAQARTASVLSHSLGIGEPSLEWSRSRRPLRGPSASWSHKRRDRVLHARRQALPHRLPLPRALVDELLQALLVAVGEARRHRLDRLAAPVEHQAAQVGLAPAALIAARQRAEHLRREGDQLAARLGKLRRLHELRVLRMVPPMTTMISSPGFAAAQRRPAQANGVLLVAGANRTLREHRRPSESTQLDRKTRFPALCSSIALATRPPRPGRRSSSPLPPASPGWRASRCRA